MTPFTITVIFGGLINLLSNPPTHCWKILHLGEIGNFTNILLMGPSHHSQFCRCLWKNLIDLEIWISIPPLRSLHIEIALACCQINYHPPRAWTQTIKFAPCTLYTTIIYSNLNLSYKLNNYTI